MFRHLFTFVHDNSITSCLCHRIWNYEESTLLNSFENHDYPDKGISKLCLVNELDESLLLVASSKSLTEQVLSRSYMPDFLELNILLNFTQVMEMSGFGRIILQKVNKNWLLHSLRFKVTGQACGV